MKGWLLSPKAAKPTRETRKNKDHITCYRCNEIGNYSNECKKDAEQGKQFLTIGENEKLIEDLQNQYTQGIKSFPQTLSDAFILLNNWKNNPRNLQRYNMNNMNEGVAFVTKGSKTNKGNKKKQRPPHMLQMQ